MNELIGKKYVFDDGAIIEVLQIKMREDEEGVAVPVVTYTTSNGRSLPRKLLMNLTEFQSTFGHLFDDN